MKYTQILILLRIVYKTIHVISSHVYFILTVFFPYLLLVNRSMLIRLNNQYLNSYMSYLDNTIHSPERFEK